MLLKEKILSLLTVLAVIFSTRVWAQEEKDENNGIAASTTLEAQISSNIELKVILTQSLVFPFLRGSGPLTEGNTLKTAISADFTPISFNGALALTLTPVAFLEVTGGAKAGSGWNINLFGGDIYGIGINAPGEVDIESGFLKSKITGKAFEGLLWSAWGGGAFQFDLAAVYPGDWNHVLFRTYHEAKYAAYTRAEHGESWFFESDYGENRNGWVYNASYVLGYQMPLSPVLNLAGFMAEMRKNLYDSPNGDFWGDSLGYWILSGLFNFTITPAFSATLAVQMHTRRNHGRTDLENEDLLFYQDLPLNKNHGERRLVFYRAALLLDYKLR
ncbi:MAG: hypothetical protein LBH43_14115 [Treponema sp.]|jgi:hypothetical protein|nr:hypothetical protein [Treponema sp.]